MQFELRFLPGLPHAAAVPDVRPETAVLAELDGVQVRGLTHLSHEDQLMLASVEGPHIRAIFPASFLTHQPLGGTGTFATRQRFASATSEIPIDAASVRVGWDQTCS